MGVEFKTPSAIEPTSSRSYKKLILEFIGAYKSRSNKNLPILFLSTDLRTFRFVWIPDLEKNTIRVFVSQDSRYSISLINEFIEYHHNRQQEDTKTNHLKCVENDEPKSARNEERKLKVLAAYERLQTNGELESRKFTSSLTH